MKRAVVWLRNDLRLNDNIVLSRAMALADELCLIYCIDPLLFKHDENGLSGIGDFRMKFVLESLQDLRDQLEAAGNKLIIRCGDPLTVIPGVVSLLQAKKVFTTQSADAYGQQQEEALEHLLWKMDCDLHCIWQHTLFHKDDLPFAISHLPDVFTNFRMKIEKESDVRNTEILPQPLVTINFIEEGSIPCLSDLGMEEPAYDKRSVLKFEGGETIATERLKAYLWEADALKSYKETRNQLIGANYSTKLSAWLSVGCISPRTIYEEIKKYEEKRVKNESTYWLVFELLWRDFFYFVALKYGRALFQREGLKRNDNLKIYNNERFKSWAEGETGVSFIDANMRELNTTGYMSNRGRQNVASYLINDLGCDWTLGAKYFQSKLIDYDASLNWGNWSYLAGVGNDPRKNRYFNIEAQQERYDANGEYVRLFAL